MKPMPTATTIRNPELFFIRFFEYVQRRAAAYQMSREQLIKYIKDNIENDPMHVIVPLEKEEEIQKIEAQWILDCRTGTEEFRKSLVESTQLERERNREFVAKLVQDKKDWLARLEAEQAAQADLVTTDS